MVHGHGVGIHIFLALNTKGAGIDYYGILPCSAWTLKLRFDFERSTHIQQTHQNLIFLESSILGWIRWEGRGYFMYIELSDFMIPMIIILELKFDSCIFISLFACCFSFVCVHIRSWAEQRENPHPLPASPIALNLRISENPDTNTYVVKYGSLPTTSCTWEILFHLSAIDHAPKTYSTNFEPPSRRSPAIAIKFLFQPQLSTPTFDS